MNNYPDGYWEHWEKLISLFCFLVHPFLLKVREETQRNNLSKFISHYPHKSIILNLQLPSTIFILVFLSLSISDLFTSILIHSRVSTSILSYLVVNLQSQLYIFQSLLFYPSLSSAKPVNPFSSLHQCTITLIFFNP